VRYVGEVWLDKAGRSAKVALLLAVALLLCHGALGAHHQVHQTPTADLHLHAPGQPPHENHGGSSAAGTEVPAKGHEGDCAGCVAYSAVLLVVTLGVLQGLLRGAHVWRSIATSMPSPIGFAPPVLHAARGPTLPVLQVFRL
jgi:hypothetical protein